MKYRKYSSKLIVVDDCDYVLEINVTQSGAGAG
jgi:hypothetical protein